MDSPGRKRCAGLLGSVCRSFLLWMLLISMPSSVVSQQTGGGTVSFAVSQVLVDEGTASFTTISIPLVREGGTVGLVAVSITVVDPDSDFLSSSIVATFADGSAETTATAILNNDNNPEGNETFTMTLVAVNSNFGATLGTPASLEITVRANDDPHGVLQFDSNSLSADVLESVNDGGSVYTLEVVRQRGTFGQVTVDFEVVPSDPSLGFDDLSPTAGQLVFPAGVTTGSINLTVISDTIPEASEIFYVRLANPTGGSVLGDASNTQASVTIQPNDAPISWSQQLMPVDEDSGLVQLIINRGVLPGGGTAGDLDIETTVTVTTNSGSAASGTDFDPISRTVTFSPGLSSISIGINILDDDLPEGDEMFTVVLSDPSQDAVLSTPSIITILIRLNDDAGGLAFFASPGPEVAGEDEQTPARFIIRRTQTLRNLIVEWRITNTQDGQLASSDFQPSQGNITILDGQMDGLLEILAFDDALPEVSESFTVELVRVVSEFGGLSDNGPRLASLIVTESDDVYGLFNWANDSLLSVAGSAPRELRLAVTRRGDSIGIVTVDYSITYLPPAVLDPSQLSDSSTALTLSGFIEFRGGDVMRSISLTLSDTAFLETGGRFFATLTNASLTGGASPLIPPSSSPRVGERSQVSVQVSALVTSGFISFTPQSLQVSVAEFDDASSVNLNITRTGSFGTATITWSISPFSSGATISEIGVSAGVVVIPSGANTASIEVIVLPDDLPEINENFTITLLQVAESNQMILPEQSLATVTILANDDPAGIFSISNSTRGPYFLNEDSNSILIISIVRGRGDLTRELIRYDLVGDQGEIAGGQGLADFQEGSRQFDVTLFVMSDNIPELNESFIFTISTLNSNVELGVPTMVDVTVLANDDYAGVFSFSNTSLTISIAEPGNGIDTIGPESRAMFVVIRERGTFESIGVSWEVTNPAASLSDLSATSGVVTFVEGQISASFQITALPDDISEGDETFSILLSEVSGGGRLATSATAASLTILQNDDPVFLDGSVFLLQEGDTHMLTLIRGGQANGIAEVRFTLNQTGSPEDVLVSPEDGLVVFANGQTQATVIVEVVDDSIPEEDESVSLALDSIVSGDAVLSQPRVATLLIQQSDDPNGAFAFSEDSLIVETEEGRTLSLIVMRGGGSFGSVSLSWTIYSISMVTGSRSPANTTDISPVTAFISFSPGELSQTVSLNVQDDTIPELMEMFEVQLSIPSTEGIEGARLENDSVSIVIIAASDEPNGVLRISDASTMVTVAEDVPPDDLALGQSQIQVERTFGVIGAVQVLWEVLPTLENTLPNFTDLVFFGERGPGVTITPSRPDTGTTALRFTGQAGAIVTIPDQYIPSNISSGFTISLWLQPSSETNGVLLAKSSGTSTIYSLSLISDGNNFLLRLTYQQSLNEQPLGVGNAEVSLLKSDLTDGLWHSIVVTVGDGRAVFYRDNNFIDSRSLQSLEFRDDEGTLTLGGRRAGDFYMGTLQDIRIYQGILQLSQVATISTDPASSSLTPVSGYLSYGDGAALASLTIRSVDDTLPEPPQIYDLSLRNVNGGARLSGDQDTAVIEVLKSDSSNGMFGFDEDVTSSVIGEPGEIVLSVNRSEGTFDDVIVSWEVRVQASDMIASEDFSPALGSVVFRDGETTQMFNVSSLDENVPELDENFIIVLTSAVVNSSQVSSTPSSGASIDLARSRFNLSVSENDFPYGLIQFSTSAPIPGQPITMATVMPEILVSESDGAVVIYVVRAQGTVGDVSVEYFTSDGTATSTQLGLQPDYVASAGVLRYGSGETTQTITLNLVDDADPELAKTFYVNLTNPQTNPPGESGIPGLDVGQSLAITIQPSDDAFGRFAFSPDSLSFVVSEEPGSVTLTVVREGGTFGMVSVYWLARVTMSDGGGGGEGQDVSPSSGEIIFEEGETQQQFTVLINDDMIAELLEVITIQLVNVTVGASLTSQSAATITIQASDHPYGRFVFSPVYRPSEGVAEAERVEVVVTREFGTLGQVMVDVQTVASQGIEDDPILTQLPDLQQFIDNSQLATTGEDYEVVNETLIFEDGDTSRSFYINISSDSIPEINEYLFVVITSVELNPASLTSVDLSVLPSVVPGNESLAILVIAENDDARGVVQFSQGAISVAEPAQDFIILQRSEGTFGSIMVQWEAIPVTAAEDDYSPSGGIVIMEAGVAMVTLPLIISEDSIPEFSEMLTVRMLSVLGGGRMGTITSSAVTIQASDDPNGAFEFAVVSRQLSIEEPEDNEPPSPVTLTVQRRGGEVGVVSVSWRVTGDGSADISPVSGDLQFITGSTQQSFLLSVLPDTIPELDEVFSIELLNVTGGGNLGDFPVSIITIPSNDGPYGVIELATLTSVTTEVGDNGTSLAMLSVIRSIGSFGEIRVFFDVEATDPAVLALANGSIPVLFYFSPPMLNQTLRASALLQAPQGIQSLEECGRACISDRNCLSFSFGTMDTDTMVTCELYLAIQAEGIIVETLGLSYYEKIQDRVLPFYQAVASEGNDFLPVVGDFVTIPGGMTQASLSVMILGDAIPELDESLTVRLTNVELVPPSSAGGLVMSGGTNDGAPVLGNIIESSLVIAANDDPQGVFSISGNDGNSTILVPEPSAVTLRVTRERGSIGEVAISWSVSGGTALQGQDYTGSSGATLVFSEGQTEANIALIILEDQIPEVDETVIVTLSNPTGGASIAAGLGGRTTVIISANDGVAGVVSLSPTSRSAVVREGDSVEFVLVRSVSAMGRVEVDWEITGTTDPALEFVSTRGTAIFIEGENMTTISVVVRSDATPELAEGFTLTLTTARTLSSIISSGGGEAIIETEGSTATITIGASNNPHGQVSFLTNSLLVMTEEGATPQLTIVRQFGAFGIIDVTYRAENGSVNDLVDGSSLASPGVDFVSEERTVRLMNGQQSEAINIQTINDTAPELHEVFVVRLLSVTLVGDLNDSIPPSLGASSTAEVVIIPNDSPSGEITFIQDSYSVLEDVGSVDIIISREQGNVADVSVVYFTINVEATNGNDYIFEPLDDVMFDAGQSSSVLSIPIVDDMLPEIEEDFCIGLRLPRGGAILGNITTTCVTILPNDDAYGVFRFSQDSLLTVLQETVGTATEGNVAELRVERTGGLFGQVTIQYEISALSPEGAELSDLVPNRIALFFDEGVSQEILQIEAVMDHFPELTESFSVSLLPPADIGRLSINSTLASIQISANQDPNGVVELRPLRTELVNGGGIQVEETAGFVEFEVVRSGGTFGEISVMLQTSSRTATSAFGFLVHNAVSQTYNTSSANIWFSFGSRSGQSFLTLGTDSQVLLYDFRGVFTPPVQSLPADGVTGFTQFATSLGDDILVVANGGSEGNREIESHVYRLTDDNQLMMVHGFPTFGVSDVISFLSPSSLEWYVVVANSEDNTGNPNVDSTLYRWNGTELVPSQNLATIGASALEVFTIDGTLYLAIASLTDTRSQVFLWTNNRFRLDHTFTTQQVSDLTFLSPYLIVTSVTSGLSILTRSGDGSFISNLTLPLQEPVRVEKIEEEFGSAFFVTNRDGPGQMFIFEENALAPTELTSVSFPVSRHVYPFTISSGEVFVGAAGASSSVEQQSIIYEIDQIDPNLSDFNARNLTLLFGPGESRLLVAISILDDSIPEIDEDFVVSLSSPVGGARLGPLISSTITILTNDNAHGLIAFSNRSRSIILSERDSNFVVPLEVERRFGTFGLVRVDWTLTGDHTTGEITPASGQVTFEDGAAMATIMLTIQADTIAELNEVTTITLTNVVENGVTDSGDPSRGAGVIPGETEAVVTVQANDDPHGVVAWSPTLRRVQELEGANGVYQLTIVRESGAIGAIVISYSTESNSSEAQALEDYIPLAGEVVMVSGQTAATVALTVLHDDIPESDESLLINITRVRIADEGDREGSSTPSPRVLESAQVVEVIIEENDNNRGLLNFQVASVRVEEVPGSQVVVEVTRTRGLFGSISVEYSINEDTAISSSDYEPTQAGTGLTGMLSFETGQDTALINITIVNDQIPERDERFAVVLMNAIGGAEIGTQVSTEIIIESNDDINGVFSFADNSLLIVVPEGSGANGSVGVAFLTVQRGISFVGETIVFWEVNDEGRQDLEPNSGNLTFMENSTEQSFSVRAVEDGIPEPFEAFVIRLTSLVGGGRIVDPRESFVAIQASDDPAGVLGLEQFPEGLVVNEGDVLMVGVVRSGGTSGTVTLTWDITPQDTSVFVSVRDTVVLLDGEAGATITIQTLSDEIPEVRRSFSLQILSTSIARIDLNATAVEIIIPASNNPHGTVQFASSALISTSEETGSVNIGVVRSGGLNGYIRINFTITLGSANSTDFNIIQPYLIIPSDMSTATIEVEIVDDFIPELDETFSLELTSVELLNVTRDVTEFPSLGSPTVVVISIAASDSPFGSISLTQALYNAVEGSTVTVTLERTGGALGVSTVSYATVNGAAVSGQDYSASAGTMVFLQGQTVVQVPVSITDDDTPEVVEDFRFVLLDVSPGAIGNITMTTILIEASDSPFGIIGFQSDRVMSGVSIANPTVSPEVVSLTVVRMGGLLGSTDISWNVTGPGGSELPSSDISPSTLAGVLTLSNGQSSGVIEVVVLSTSIDEPEEMFRVSLISTSNDVAIDSNFNQVTITVGQNGSPFGTISFLGEVLGDLQVQEMDVTVTLSLPLERDGGLSTEVNVVYTVTRVSGDGDVVELDVTPATGLVTFLVSQGRASIDLTILPDNVGELDEMFQVTLSETSGATINPQAGVARFTIRANGNLFGEYGLVNGRVSLSTSGTTTSRMLSYTIQRRREGSGSMVDTNITLQHTYTQGSIVSLLPSMISRTFSTSSSELVVSLPLPSSSFLSSGAAITVSITSVTVVSPSELAGNSGGISPEDGTLQVDITDAMANIEIGFTSQSLIATVDEGATVNNVVLSVFRRGELGAAQFSWTTTGVPSSPGFVLGSLLPQTGNIQFPLQQNTTTVTLTASPVTPHGRAEVFEVQLQVLSLNTAFPSQVNMMSERSLIEPMGILQLANTMYTALEGETVTIQVWRRYGSLGSVVVSGVASLLLPSELPPDVTAALPRVDFSSTPVSITLEEGVTTGQFNIILFSNNATTPLKAFRFSLTSVTSSSSSSSSPLSPRLSSSNTQATVTIIDDEGGAGVFQLSPTSANTMEGATLTFNVERSRGTNNRVSVRVRTVVSGSASSGADFSALDEELIFENGVPSMPMSISILDDTVPEPTEDFSILLSASQGGLALVNPDANILAVSIEASDNPAGAFSFVTASLTLSEDGPTSGQLEVRRTGSLMGVVILSWTAIYTDGRDSSSLTSILVETQGTVTFDDNSAEPSSNILLQLQLQDNIGVSATSDVFTVRLSSDASGVGLDTPSDAIVTVLPRAVGMFRIAQSNLTSVATSVGEIYLIVERTAGLESTSTLRYTTSSPREAVTIGRLTFQPATPQLHFPVINVDTPSFNPGQTSVRIDVGVLSVGSSPVVFMIEIQATNSDVVINGSALVLISPPSPLTSLYSIYLEAITISSSSELEKVSLDMNSILDAGLVSGSAQNQSDVTRLIIDELILKTLSSSNNVDYSNTLYVSTMLDIFQTLLVPNTSFAGRSQLVQSMKSFAYSLLEDSSCNSSMQFFRTQFYLEASKLSPFNLTGRRFASNNDADYVQLPTQVITTPLDCVNVHFIEFFNEQLFIPPTLNSKVLSFGIEGVTLSRTSDPILYRIHATNNLGILPDDNDCLLWDEMSRSWDQSTCSPQTHFVLQENYLQCACSQLGDMAGAQDVDVGYGWTLPAALSAVVVIIAIILAIIVHLRYFFRTQLAARILLNVLFSVFLFQLIILVDIFASDTEGLSPNGCAALGALLQFTAVAQFIWMAVMAFSLWANFLGFLKGNEPLVIYILNSWGLSVLVVLATIVIGRFAFNIQLNSSSGLYGAVGDLCFIPLLPASLLSTALPAVLSLLAMISVLAHTCIYWNRWEDSQSIYYEAYNRTEIPLLLVLFGLIFLSSLSAFLHVHIGLVYTFGAFVIMNTVLGLYIFVVYFMISWRTLTRKHDKYDIDNALEDGAEDYYGAASLSTMAGGSKLNLLDKDEYSVSTPNTGVVSLGMHPTSDSGYSPRKSPSHVVPIGEETKDDAQMDDLLFMLRTQNFDGSVTSDDSETTRQGRIARGEEHFERRRISIADTHL